MEQELKPEKEVSKQGRSHTMNIQSQTSEKEMSSKNIASQLNSLSHKSEERKVGDQQIDFLVNEFAINRHKAVNILRKMDLKQAVRFLVNS